MDIREKLVELFDEAARICNNQDCRACGYFREANCINKTIIDHLIAHGVTVQEWRPASEPPREVGEYLVAHNVAGERVYTVVIYDSVCFRYKFMRSPLVDVTHWMPLPEAPKGE